MTKEIGDKNIIVHRSDVTASVLGVGVERGDPVIFHSALSSMGTVVGGADTVIDGFLEAVGPEGTVAVPTPWWHHTDPPMKIEDWDIRTSPSWVGKITEVFRHRPDSIRSDNPTHAVSAIGARAVELTRDHGKSGLRPCVYGDAAFAEQSPWERFYRWNGAHCFIGVDLRFNTMGHYIETRFVERNLMNCPADRRSGFEDRVHRWGKPGVWPRHDFAKMSERLTEMGLIRMGRIGSATLRCIRARPMFEAMMHIFEAEPEQWFNDEFVGWLKEIREAASR